MRKVRVVLAVLAFALMSGTLFAQSDYPNKPIRLVIPSGTGGGADFIGRLLAQKLSEIFKSPVIADNRPGGGQLIGTEHVARSPADGYTLLLAFTDHTYAPFLHESMRYDTVKDFTPVTMIGSLSFIFAVNSAVPARSVREFITLAKSSPGKFNYASAGIGSSTHIAAVLLNSLADIDTAHVAYKGMGPAMPDLLSGRVQYIIASKVALMPHVREGKLRALAVTASKRDPSLPDLPTMVEAGVPGYEAGVWYAVLAPAGTPADIVARLNSALHLALSSPDAREKLSEQGITITPSTPAELGDKINSELERWGKLIRDAKLRI